MCNSEERLKTFWNGKIEAIHAQFTAELARKEKYCELCEVSFHRGTPNYSSPIQQQLYLLRYFSAYLFEYFETFSQLATILDEDINIVSFGCGSGIDGAAAECVFQECAYRGIDIVRWHNWFSNGTRNIQSASLFTPTNENIFVFPKSLNEFPESVIESLTRRLSQTSAQNICIINSKRSINDNIRCSNIIRSFGGACRLHTISPENKALIRYHHWFSYPDNIKNHIENISSSCPSRQREEEICCEHLCNMCDGGDGGERKPMDWRVVLRDTNFLTDIYLIRR